jgi:hypothetical protein
MDAFGVPRAHLSYIIANNIPQKAPQKGAFLYSTTLFKNKFGRVKYFS